MELIDFFYDWIDVKIIEYKIIDIGILNVYFFLNIKNVFENLNGIFEIWELFELLV